MDHSTYFNIIKSNTVHLQEIAHHIKERRKALGISQEDLASLSGVSLRTLKTIESGKSNPTLQTLFDLVNVLGMEIKLGVKQLNS
jgi:putative transcriptional regulator